MLPPPTASGDAGRLLDDELAVHHGNAPVAVVAELLRGLEAIAEKARSLAETDRFSASTPA